jgi:hypothetical protein
LRPSSTDEMEATTFGGSRRMIALITLSGRATK